MAVRYPGVEKILVQAIAVRIEYPRFPGQDFQQPVVDFPAGLQVGAVLQIEKRHIDCDFLHIVNVIAMQQRSQMTG